MLVKELTYYILDRLKLISDDTIINEEHIIFLCKKYRAFLIKKEQEKERSNTDIASEFEYQEICLDLEKVAAIDGNPCAGGYYLRTTSQIPKLLEGTEPRVYPIDFYQGTNITYVPRDRMRYVGTNKYTQNLIYASLGTDLHLYLKSANPQFMYLKKLRMNAIFEDFDAASELLCSNSQEGTAVCDTLDMDFPIREYLVPPLIELVVKELSGTKYMVATDNRNDASENIPTVKN